MALTANIDEGSGFRGFTEGTNLRKPAQDRGAIQPIHADVVKQLDNAMPDWREILQRQSETPLGKYGTLADDARADMLRSRAQNPEADSLTEIPNPYGPPAQDLGQDAQDNPGVNLRGQFQSTATQALGAMATGPEKANMVKLERASRIHKFYGR